LLLKYPLSQSWNVWQSASPNALISDCRLAFYALFRHV